MCGASQSQKDVEAAQQQFMNEAMKQQETSWGQDQEILNQMRAVYQPIFAKGPSQEGFSPQQKAQLNTQVTEGTAQSYAQAAQALNQSLAAQGGGNVFIPSGATASIRAGLASSAAGKEASQRLGIAGASWEQGYKNWLQAAAGMGDMGRMVDPVNFSGAATKASGAAGETANQIAEQNNSWVNAAIGAAGRVAGAAVMMA